MTTLGTGIRPEPGGLPSQPSRTGHLARVVAAVLASLALLGVAVWPQLSARLTGDEIVLRVQPERDVRIMRYAAAAALLLAVLLFVVLAVVPGSVL